MERIRVRVKVGDVEVELEGPEAFVLQHRERYERLLDLAWQQAHTRRVPVQEGSSPAARLADLAPGVPEQAQVLLAAHLLQTPRDDHSFSVEELVQLFKDAGVAMYDVSGQLKALLAARHALRVKGGRYRVSSEGFDEVNRLLAAAEAE